MNFIPSRKINILSIIGLSILLSLPVIIQAFVVPDGYHYTGLRMLTLADIPVYYMYLNQVQEGSLLFKNLFSIESSLPYLNIFWLFSGLFGAMYNLEPHVTFALLRFLLGIALLILVYHLVGKFIKQSQRFFAFLFILFASGFGFLHSMINLIPRWPNNSLDVWLPEISLYLTLMHSPHNIFSTGLLLFELYYGYRAITERSYRLAMLVGVSSLIHFQFHPYYIPPVLGILAVFSVVQFVRNGYPSIFKHFPTIFIIGIFALPAIGYHYFYLNDFVSLSRAISNTLPLPKWSLVLTSLGLLFPFAVVGIIDAFKKQTKSTLEIFLLTWFFVQSILIVSPVLLFQRKLFLGYWFVLGIYSWRGLLLFMKWFRARVYNFSSVLAFVIISISFFLTPFYSLAREYLFINNVVYHEVRHLFFMSDDEYDAYQWLDELTTETPIVASRLFAGVFIPSYSNAKIYLGHLSESVLPDVKIVYLNMLFDSTVSDEWKEDFLRLNGITHLWWGWEEKTTIFKPYEASYLSPVYESSEVTIFEVFPDNDLL